MVMVTVMVLVLLIRLKPSGSCMLQKIIIQYDAAILITVALVLD